MGHPVGNRGKRLTAGRRTGPRRPRRAGAGHRQYGRRYETRRDRKQHPMRFRVGG